MYFYTGSNIFKQWIGCSEDILSKFTGLYKGNEVTSEFNVQDAVLVYIGWSHNVYNFNDQFYIVGDYRGSGQHLEKIDLPKQCIKNSNLMVVSDDYQIVLVNKDTCEYWSITLENKEVKKFNLAIEVPIDIDPKRLKQEDCILKCVATNGLLMFITNKGLVYSGLMPNLIDTSDCDGDPIDIQCGNEHFMLLTSTGRVYTWGNGRRLQLGHGDVSILDTPTEVDALAGIRIVKISAGGWHSLVVSEFGDLYAWGWNDTGQLGIRESSNSESLKSYALPTLVDIIDDNGIGVNINIKDIACGSRHSAVLLDDDSVWTSGYNKYGQLGHSVQDHPAVYNFKKCCFFKNVNTLMCGPWSTVVNVINP